MSLPHQQSKSGGVIPVQKVPLQQGASSERESALIYRNNQIDKQNHMNKTLSGGKKNNKKRNYK